MSDDQLARLRADLEVIERYEGRMYALAAAKAEIGNKIRKVEAEQDDPWREAKAYFDSYRNHQCLRKDFKKAIEHYDHLTAENDRLAARVAELEEALQNFIDSVVFIDPSVYPQSLQQAREAMAGAKPYRLKRVSE